MEDLNKIKNQMLAENAYTSIAEDYYNGRQDILDNKIYFYNDEGVQIENKYASNVKFVNPHFRKLVEQSTNFMFGEPLQFNTDDEFLNEALKIYITDETHRLLYDIVEKTSTIGRSWVYVYRNNEGLPDFQMIESTQVTEITDENSGETEAVYRFYNDVAEVWYNDGDKVIYRKDKKGKWQEEDRRKHTVYDEQGNIIEGFGIPWKKIKNNKDETSDLQLIKDATDIVDLMYSYAVNELQDFPSNTHILKSGGNDDINKVMHNVRTTGGVKVNPNSDEEYKVEHSTVSIQARLDMAETSKEAIYTIGSGFDASQVASANGSVTNEVLMAAQRDLINKTRGKEIELRVFLKWMLEIILKDIERKDLGSYAVSDIEIEFTYGLEENLKERAEVEKSEAETVGIKLDNILKVEHIIGDEKTLELVADLLGVDADEVRRNRNEEGYESLIAEEVM